MKEAVKLINLHHENLKDSQARYGGVYIAEIQIEEDTIDLEVELDTGSIAFIIRVKKENKDSDIQRSVEFAKTMLTEDLKEAGIDVYESYSQFENEIFKHYV